MNNTADKFTTVMGVVGSVSYCALQLMREFDFDPGFEYKFIIIIIGSVCIGIIGYYTKK